jgi:hypothetical protein
MRRQNLDSPERIQRSQVGVARNNVRRVPAHRKPGAPGASFEAGSFLGSFTPKMTASGRPQRAEMILILFFQGVDFDENEGYPKSLCCIAK